MYVTKLTPVTKAKYKVYLDEQFAFVLYKGELRSYSLKENETVSRKTIEEIYDKVLLLRGKKRALHLLQKRAYTERQLWDKLSENLYPEQVIESVITYVKEYHYIDDLQYVKDYITYYSDYRSRGRIEMDLLKKGIRRDLIERVYSEMDTNVSSQQEKKLIMQFLEKKHYDLQSADYVEKQKMMAYLYRKGFSMDMIHQILG